MAEERCALAPAAPCCVSGGWNKAWALQLGRIIPAPWMLSTNTGHQEHKNRLPRPTGRSPLKERSHFTAYLEALLHQLSSRSAPSALPQQGQVLPLIPFHNSILWADVCHATSAENGCSNQGPLQTLLLWHSSCCRSISVLSWAACKWLWIHRAPALVLNPLSKCLLRPLQASCCYSGRAALQERL